MRFKAIIIIVCVHLFGAAFNGYAQTGVPKNKNNEIYIDAKGIIRLQKDGSEASFFGVNYTVPFAYGYRSHKALGVDPEKAMDADVYHLARLGVTAFRVHVWDWEISDSTGNLKENEHLRLFDYLLAKLEERNIRIIITPIAFWGNGYPERDEHTGSFSDIYGKEKALVTDKAFAAQERYLQQFFKHVNPYTKKTYGADRFVIATEINNEPHHSGAKALTTTYINRMMAAIKSTGWNKPVFYNISESPWYADAVAASNVNGFSFQWYPTGLVAGHEIGGNLLPQVDHYVIPFDTIPSFKNRARMVYEFESGDVLQPYMYPAMARSFKGAGFQWATQFAYDPMATAFANTEYQTHYLNLAYTPAKAISLLIAGKVFQQVPVFKSYGAYPADTVFGPFTVSYKQQLSQMNTPAEFYYTNNTTAVPVKPAFLQHIAGVGSSTVVNYSGTGAYFIDKIAPGTWRLEVMPDAVRIRDPFEKASLSKEVTSIVYSTRSMQVTLTDLGKDFTLEQVDQSASPSAATGTAFEVKPGVYLLQKKGKGPANLSPDLKVGNLKLNEFYAPLQKIPQINVLHKPLREVSANVAFEIKATLTGVDAADTVMLQLNRVTGAYRMLRMQETSPYQYTATVPADVAQPGLLNYRIMILKKGGSRITFPGDYQGNPYAWDYYHNDAYETFVAAPNSSLKLYEPSTGRETATIYSPEWRSDTYQYVTGLQGELLLKLQHQFGNKAGGMEAFIKPAITARQPELAGFKSLVIKAGADTAMSVKVTLVDEDANAYSTTLALGEQVKEITIPLNSFIKDEMILLPRPYPGFQPFTFKTNNSAPLQLAKVEKVQVSIPGVSHNKFSVQIGEIRLETNN